jgi:SnoaL-like domain
MSAGLELLLAERDIARALARFARAMDERDWQGLDEVLSVDATADFGIGPVTGRAAIVSFVRSFLDACGPTQHLLGNLTVEVQGAQALSRCYVADMHVGEGEKAHLTFRTLGEYHDRWQLREGRWWIVNRTKLNHAHIGAIEVLGPGPAR